MHGLPVTSKQKSMRHGCQILDLERVGLKKASMVKLELIEIRHIDLVRFLGTLSDDDRYRIGQSLKAGGYGSTFL